MNPIRSREDLVREGLLRPQTSDWRVRLVFTDGTERVVRISPGRMDEAEAVVRAKRHAGIFDETILSRVEASRVQVEETAPAFGLVRK